MLRSRSCRGRIWSAIMFILISGNIAAQNSIKIGGKVVDEYGHPLQDVIVHSTLDGHQVKTDQDGAFSLAAPLNSVLMFTLRNYDIETFKPKWKEDNVLIRLRESYLRKTDTIDVVYRQHKADLFLGSMSTVNSSQISTTPAPLYLYALTGRLPGLYTEQIRGYRSFPGTGDANSVADLAGTLARTGLTPFSDNNEISIKLRGQNPVVIVDGIQRDIFSLDPESIESVSVLKDGLSAIDLGQRSSRGVLLVTTNKPKIGPPRLSFTAEAGWQEPLKLPTPVNAFDYAYLVNEALQNDGRKPLYSVKDLEGYKNGSNPYAYPNVDWYDLVLKKNAPMNRYNLNVGGGGNVARYAISLGYMNQEGLLKTGNSDATLQLQRYLINSKVDIDVTKYFNVGVQLFGRIQDGNQPGAGVGTILDNLLRTPNNAYPVYNPNGSYGGNNSFNTNLKASLDTSGYKMNNDRDIMANVDLKYNFDRWVKGLWVRVKGNLSVQSATLTDRSMQVPVYLMQPGNSDTTYARYGSANSQANSFYAISNARYWYAQGEIGYAKSVKGSTFTGNLMADMRRSTLNFDLPGTATNYVAKLQYNYLEKYMLEAAVNYSGYDRYPPGKQYGLFYAAGAGWNIAKENFIKDNYSWINLLKLRATYAHTGNGVDNSGYFIWRQTFNQSNDETGISGIEHMRAQMAIVESGLANTGITWEQGNKMNAGFDISLFKDHFGITGDFYRDIYSDLLQIRGKSIAILGKPYPVENIGKNLYTGAELNLTYRNNLGAFNYFFTANGSLEKTKVLFMDEQKREYPWNVRTGLPVGQRFGYVADGFFGSMAEIQSGALIPGYDVKPGDIKFKDLNNDGIIDQFDMAPIGKTKPMLYCGITTGFNYKGIGFSILFQGVANRNLYIDNWNTEIIRAYGQLYGQVYNQLMSRWTPENADIATYPRLKANGGFGDGYTLSSSSFWLHSGDYWRVKNINLQYTFPYQWTSRFRVAGITAFANSQNLFTWAAYDKVDPEVSTGGAYPNQRVYNIGINIKF